MLAAALDNSGWDELLNTLRQQGLTIENGSTLNFGPQSMPAAWVVSGAGAVGRRSRSTIRTVTVRWIVLTFDHPGMPEKLKLQTCLALEHGGM